jgi:hypothetical protein
MEEFPDAEYVKISRAINRYALNDELSELEGISKAIFILIKPQLDANKRRRENGSRGGKPKESKPEPNYNLDITKAEPNGNSVSESPETTTTIFTFLEEAKKTGYTLDEKIAKEILNTGIDSDWIAERRGGGCTLISGTGCGPPA